MKLNITIKKFLYNKKLLDAQDAKHLDISRLVYDCPSANPDNYL